MNDPSGREGGTNGGTRFVFNGVFNGANHSEYLHPPRTPEEVVADVGGEPLLPPADARALMPHLDADDLAQAGWGVVWAPGLNPRIREEMQPLLDVRKEQAGPLYREIEIRPGETFFQFLIRMGASVAPIDPKGLPYYLLLVGEPVDIPFEFQYQLDVAHAVGRLSFETPEEYGRYARGVVSAEQNDLRLPRRLSVFSVQNEDDRATKSCNEYLSRPLARLLTQDVQQWGIESWYAADATKVRLRSALALDGGSRPALLLTCSHGLMFGAADPLQPTDQGAVLCADWPGPRRWTFRIPPEHYLAPRDVPNDADLSGLILFQFACFSAGTPERDSYSRAMGDEARRLAQRDSIAPLARRLLGKPGGGALAVVGHVDQVFEASYLWPGVGRQHETFESCFKSLMAGHRLGLALEPFGQRHATIATFLTALLEQWRKQPSTRPEGVTEALGEAFLWLAHNDARGYLLLGDPAVRPAVGPLNNLV